MRQLAEREERHAVRADLITLEAACALAFHRIYGTDPEHSLSMSSRAVRDAIAHALTALTAVYTFSEDRTEIKQVDYRDLRGGTFLEGGRKLCFPVVNGPPITRLAVRASAMRQLIEQLAALRGVLEAFARNIAMSAPPQGGGCDNV